MITALEGIFGITVPKWIIEVVLAALLFLFLVAHFEHKGAEAELGKLQKSSAVLIAKAQTQITHDAEQYSSAQKANQEKTDEATASVTTLQSQLADSVRQYQAYRSSHPSVSHTVSQPVAAPAGASSPDQRDTIIVRLAERGNELAGSVASLSAQLQSCQRDRDALSGLP